MTKVKGYTRITNGQVQYVSAHNREQGQGFTRDGQRANRAQREFLGALQRRATKAGPLGDAARRRLAQLGY